MPLRPLPFCEVKRKLEVAGFVEQSRKGSHVKFVKQTDRGLYTTIVPHHREVSVGAPRSILRQAGLDADEFQAL